MKTDRKFEDGWYCVTPEGSPYQAVEIQDGRIVDIACESERRSHYVGGNSHYIPVHDAIVEMGPDDLGEMLEDGDDHAAFVAMIDEEFDPSCVHVCKLDVEA